MPGLGGCQVLGVPGLGGCQVLGGVWSWGGLVAWSWGVPGPGGSGPGGVPSGDPPETAIAVGGTHPTGMHSC